MKKFLGIIILAVLLFSSNLSALTLEMDNWQFNPNAVNSYLQSTFSPIDEITFLGTALINGVITSYDFETGAAWGTFKEYGTFEATAFQNDGAIITGTGLGAFGYNVPAYELTFEMFNTEGYFAYNPTDQVNDIVFTQSMLNIYLDINDDYGTANGTFGADNGTLIAAFKLYSGTGSIDFNANNGPDGSTDITYQARDQIGLTNGLLAGVWFDSNGVDMSTYSPELIKLGITDSNNEVKDPSDVLFNEYNGKNGLVSSNFDSQLGAGDPNFFVRSDGSYTPGVVPEPGTMLLLGIGLIGLAGIGRKRKEI